MSHFVPDPINLIDPAHLILNGHLLVYNGLEYVASRFIGWRWNVSLLHPRQFRILVRHSKSLLKIVPIPQILEYEGSFRWRSYKVWALVHVYPGFK